MRALAMSSLLLAALAACSVLPPPPPYYAHPMAPLRAWIAPPAPFGSVSFHINRPAYVAVFEIVPGRGIAMLYPSYATGEMYLSAGVHSVWTGWQSQRRAYFPSLGGHGSQQPRFLYLVASEAPLRVTEFRASPMALRSALGWNHFTAWNPYAAMQELTRLILPVQEWGEWATDLYVQWPDPPPLQLAAREQPRYVMVTCQDGRRILVPFGFGFTGCPGEGIVSRPGDGEEEIRTPTRRRPEPTAHTGEERTAEWPRVRPGVGEEQPTQPEQPVRPRRGADREAEGEARERERVRPHEARPARPPRSQEPRPEPRRTEPRAEPRQEARPAPPPRSAPAAQPRRESPPPPPRSSGSSEPRERKPEPQAQQQ